MKPNTFNIPAYKFALVKFHNQFYGDDKNYNLWAENEMLTGMTYLMPWENFDGLTIEEIFNTLGEIPNNFTFVCYTTNNNNIYIKYRLGIFDLKKNLSRRLDMLIEEGFSSLYSSQNEESQRVIRGFFERYQDNSYEDTVKRIRNLNQDTNK